MKDRDPVGSFSVQEVRPPDSGDIGEISSRFLDGILVWVGFRKAGEEDKDVNCGMVKSPFIHAGWTD